MTWPNVVNALIGLWFVIAPFVLGYSGQTGAMWTSIVGGAILFVLGGWAALDENTRRQRWVQYVNGLVGIWFVLFPFVFALSATPAILWTSLIGGIVALVLSAWLAFGVLAKEQPAR
jgi:hypothetical protein